MMTLPYAAQFFRTCTEKRLACHFCGDINLFCLKHLICVNDFPQTVRLYPTAFCVFEQHLRCKQADLQLSNCFLGRQSSHPGNVVSQSDGNGHFICKTHQRYKQLNPLRLRPKRLFEHGRSSAPVTSSVGIPPLKSWQA